MTEHNGFTHVGFMPYTKADGTVITLALWEKPCATCGQPFQVMTGCSAIANPSNGGGLSLANCEEHRGYVTERQRDRWANPTERQREAGRKVWRRANAQRTAIIYSMRARAGRG